LKNTFVIYKGDSIALAESIMCNGTLVTSDHADFAKIETAEKIKISWFR